LFNLLERALQLGSLFSPEEALKIGLVDKLGPDMETATAVAEAELKEFLQIPGTLNEIYNSLFIRFLQLKILKNRYGLLFVQDEDQRSNN
jgi:hypothetical protein